MAGARGTRRWLEVGLWGERRLRMEHQSVTKDLVIVTEDVPPGEEGTGGQH